MIRTTTLQTTQTRNPTIAVEKGRVTGKHTTKHILASKNKECEEPTAASIYWPDTTLPVRLGSWNVRERLAKNMPRQIQLFVRL